jgi:hypothetical protein
VTLLIPTVMMTKASWYLDPFYPIFAIGVAALIVRVANAGVGAWPRWRAIAMIVVVIGACGVAEGRLLWHSLRNRAMRGSVQELLREESAALDGRTVYRDHWTHADRFVLVAMVHGTPAIASDVHEFLRVGAPGDYLLTSASIDSASLVQVRTAGRQSLYRRE